MGSHPLIFSEEVGRKRRIYLGDRNRFQASSVYQQSPRQQQCTMFELETHNASLIGSDHVFVTLSDRNGQLAGRKWSFQERKVIYSCRISLSKRCYIYKPVWCEEGDVGLWVCEHEKKNISPLQRNIIHFTLRNIGVPPQSTKTFATEQLGQSRTLFGPSTEKHPLCLWGLSICKKWAARRFQS